MLFEILPWQVLPIQNRFKIKKNMLDAGALGAMGALRDGM